MHIRSFILAIVFSLALCSQAAAQIQFFPPQACADGQLNVLAWNGNGSSTHCLQVPVCVGANKLQFDGANFICVAEPQPKDPVAPPPACSLTVPQCTGGHLVSNGSDGNGCPLTPTCVLDTPVAPIPACTQINIPQCTDGHLVSNGTDANGCPLAPTCVQDTCPNVQLLQCPAGQHAETGTSSNGCDIHCVPDLIPHCPLYQLPICPAGQHRGPVTTDSDGCSKPGDCVPDLFPHCPLYQLPICPSGQHRSPATTGSDGCTKPGECVADVPVAPIPACQQIDIPACNGGKLMGNGTDANGCPRAPTCVPSVPIAACPQINIPQCHGGKLISNGTDENGCPRAPSCERISRMYGGPADPNEGSTGSH